MAGVVGTPLLVTLSAVPLPRAPAYVDMVSMGIAHCDATTPGDPAVVAGSRQLGKDQEIGSSEVLATMFDGRIVHDVAYGIGDANLAGLDKFDKGAVGLCPHDHKH